MANSYLPPVLLELRSNVAEAVSGLKETREELSETGVAGDELADKVEAAVDRQNAALARLAEASTRTSESIRADVDAQIEAERRLAEEMGEDYDEEGRRAQLTSTQIRAASKEQVTAQKEAAAAAKDLADAQEDAAVRSDAAAEAGSGAFAKYSKVVAGATAIAGAAVVVEGVKMAATFQKQITLLHTAGGESEKNLGTVASGLKNISVATGTSLDQLAEGMYTVEKAGYRGAAGLNVAKQAAEGAKAENVDLSTATLALTDVMTDYHLKATQAAAAENMIVKGSGESKTSMQDFASSLSSIVPLASSLHISFAQVAGAIATMTQHGQSAQQSTQNLANLVTNLAGQNTVASSAMQQLGINTVDLQKDLGTRGLTGTLAIVQQALKAHTKNGMIVTSVSKDAALATHSLTEMLGGMTPKLATLSKQYLAGKIGVTDYQNAVKAMGGASSSQGLEFLALAKSSQGFSDQLKSGQGTVRTSTSAMQKMLGGMTGMRVALMLTGQNAKAFTSNVAAVGAAGQKSGKNISTWADTSKTLSVQLSRMHQFLDVILVDIGTKVIPIVSAATGLFLKHKDALLLVAGILGGVLMINLTAWIAKMAWGAAQTVGKVATMVASWMGLGPAAEGAVTEAGLAEDELVADSEAAGVAVDTAFGPIGLAVAGVGLAITLLASHWKQIWNGIKQTFDVVWAALKSTFDDVESFLKKWGSLILTVIAPFIGIPLLIIQHWGAIEDWFKNLWGDVENIFTTAIDDVVGFVEQWYPEILGILSGGILLVPALIFKYWKEIKTYVADAWTDTIDWLKGVPDKVRAVFAGAAGWLRTEGQNIITGLWNGIASAATTFWNRLSKIGTEIWQTFDGLYNDMLTIGENIVTGLWNGIESKASWLWDKVKGFGDSIVHGFKDALSILSPSQVMADEVGKWIPAGIGIGITANAGSALAAVKDLGNQIASVKVLGSGAGGGAAMRPGTVAALAATGLSSANGTSPSIAAATAGPQASTANDQPIQINLALQMNGTTLATAVERGMLRKGLTRGTTYVAFKK